MTRKNWFPPSFLFCVFLCVSSAHAGTVNAVSCASADVQSAINSASSGDTVNVPACSATWSSSVNISSKKIKIQGQTNCTGTPASSCTDATKITDNTTAGALSVGGASTSNFVEITGLTFIAQTSKANGMIELLGTMFSLNSFRIHHNHFITAAGATRGIDITGPYGLVDHNLFDVTNTGSVQSIADTGSSDGTDGGFTPWQQPLTLGTVNAVYEEDNTFNYPSNVGDSTIDNYGGARYVFRHNTVNNNEACSHHGFDSGNRRSAFSFECYNNTYTNNAGRHIRGGTIRGGTGVWFNNTYTTSGSGSAYDGFTLMVYRTSSAQSAWQMCDGTNLELGSKDLSSNGSRTATTNGGVLFCSNHRDTLCSSNADCTGGGTCSTYVDGQGSGGYMCRDQPGVTHDQVAAPIYGWNNTLNGSTWAGIGTYDGGVAPALGLGNYLQSGRDYNNNTQMPGYTPYTYPHPLQSGGTLSPPVTTVQPPSSLSAIVN